MSEIEMHAAFEAGLALPGKQVEVKPGQVIVRHGPWVVDLRGGDGLGSLAIARIEMMRKMRPQIEALQAGW